MLPACSSKAKSVLCTIERYVVEGITFLSVVDVLNVAHVSC